MIDRVHLFCHVTDHINGEDYRRSPHRVTERPRSRSRSPRGYLSVRKSPELRETARSVSPTREAIQAAAREAAEQAIHLAESEADRKSPASPPMPRVASPEKANDNGPVPPTSAVLQNLLASFATSGSMQMMQQPQLLAAFATAMAAVANNPMATPPPAPAVPSPFAGLADGAQALQTFAQLQSLFGMPNPAAQMMSMQQVNISFISVSF